jgi:hypothetical protein
LIAEFYLVDRGLRHRLPGFSSLGRLGVLPQGLRRLRHQWAHCGSCPTGRIPDERGWFDRNCPHRARSLLGDHKLEEPSRELPSGLGIDPRDLSAYDHFLQVSRRILHNHLSRVRSADPVLTLFGYPRISSGTHPCGVAICPGPCKGLLLFGIAGCQVTRWDTVSPKEPRHCSWPPAMKATKPWADCRACEHLAIKQQVLRLLFDCWVLFSRQGA